MSEPTQQPVTLRVHALAPLLFRDARPFGAAGGDETRARSLPLPLPSTLAGFLRTLTGDTLGWDWKDAKSVERAKKIALNGFLLHRECVDSAGQRRLGYVVPAPRDAVVLRDTPESPERTMVLRPLKPAEGEDTDNPDGLWPLSVDGEGKPERGYDLWTWDNLLAWLAGETHFVPEKISYPTTDERVHVALDAEKDPLTGRPRETAQEGMLYAVSYRALENRDDKGSHSQWTLDLRTAQGDLPAKMRAHLGGERRPVAVTQETDWPQAPENLREKVMSSEYISLTLLTPAVFGGGWKPEWLSVDGGGSLAPLQGAELLGAAVGRAEAVSGWNFDLRQRGPKATRRLVPAGSTYFLKLPKALTAKEFDALWLTCVSDSPADRLDGYGLAVLGYWQPRSEKAQTEQTQTEQTQKGATL